MRIYSVIKKLTNRVSMHLIAKHTCLIFMVFIFVAHPNQSFAKKPPITQAKQINYKETIAEVFGIKLGDSIEPYLEGHYSGHEMLLEDFSFKYMRLKTSVNLREIFPNTYSIELSGIPDENNRIIKIELKGQLKFPASCENDNSIKATWEFLRRKYTITKPLVPNGGDASEIFGDGEGNKIRMYCYRQDFEIEYTSHLMSAYIVHLKAERQKYKDELKKYLKEVL
jgi:hypothetical protein